MMFRRTRTPRALSVLGLAQEPAIRVLVCPSPPAPPPPAPPLLPPPPSCLQRFPPRRSGTAWRSTLTCWSWTCRCGGRAGRDGVMEECRERRSRQVLSAGMTLGRRNARGRPGPPGGPQVPGVPYQTRSPGHSGSRATPRWPGPRVRSTVAIIHEAAPKALMHALKLPPMFTRPSSPATATWWCSTTPRWAACAAGRSTATYG